MACTICMNIAMSSQTSARDMQLMCTSAWHDEHEVMYVDSEQSIPIQYIELVWLYSSTAWFRDNPPIELLVLIDKIVKFVCVVRLPSSQITSSGWSTNSSCVTVLDTTNAQEHELPQLKR